jgi:hypothetical protein
MIQSGLVCHASTVRSGSTICSIKCMAHHPVALFTLVAVCPCLLHFLFWTGRYLCWTAMLNCHVKHAVLRLSSLCGWYRLQHWSVGVCIEHGVFTARYICIFIYGVIYIRLHLSRVPCRRGDCIFTMATNIFGSSAENFSHHPPRA